MQWKDMTRDQRLAYVKAAPSKFQTAREAGEAVGATKNSILSVAHRHEVRFEATNQNKVKKTRERKPRPASEKRQERPQTSFNAFVRTGAPEKPKDRAGEAPTPAADEAKVIARINASPSWQPLDGVEPKELWQLEACQCHWPTFKIGEPSMFCAGETDEGELYCETHRRLAGGRRKTGDNGRLMPGDTMEMKNETVRGPAAAVRRVQEDTGVCRNTRKGSRRAA